MSLEELRDDDPDIALFRVLRDDGSADPARDPVLPAETLLRAYREMRRLRILDARMVALQRQGRIGFYGAAQGQEAVPIATGLVVEEGDWVFPGVREQSVMLVRGFPLSTFVAQVFGNAGDVLKGRQMPSHPSGRAVHQVSWSSCAATQLPHAVGAAWAMRACKAGAVAVGFLGDGATSQADFHSAMNFAGVWKVPCVLVCQSDSGSGGAPAERQTASRTIAVKARAYGIPGLRVDGNDLLAVVAVMRAAIDRARSGGGPTFLEAVTCGIGERASDPLDRLRRHLVELGLVSDEGDAALEKELASEVGAAIAEAERMPSSAPETLFEDVYAEMPWHLREQLGESRRFDGP